MKAVKFLTLVLSIAVLLVAFCSCNEGKPYEKSLSGMLDSLKACNFDKADEYVWGDGDIIDGLDEDELTSEAREFYKTLFSSIEYRIISSEMKDDATAEIKAEITNVDITPAIEKFIEEAFSYIIENMYGGDDDKTEAEVERILAESVKNTKLETFTKEVTVEMRLDEGEWKVVVGDGDFADAISGGMISSFKEMFSDIIE